MLKMTCLTQCLENQLFFNSKYFSDILFNQDAQNVLTTGIHDTMKDMIAAFLGSILFCMVYVYEEKSGNNIFDDTLTSPL